MGRRSKYPSLGILDTLYRLSFGSSFESAHGIEYDKLFKKIQTQYKGISEGIFKRRIHSLQVHKYIRQMPSGSLHLAQKGQQRALLRSLTAIVLRNKKTDGRDRLIIFDIPEKQRSARDVLRRKLREFECQQLQRSVYITPYVCEDELHEITRILKITPHVHVLKVMTT